MGATSTVLGKIDESKKIVLEIRCVFPPGRPSSRTVFPTRCELIRKSRTLRKRTTSAVMCNSRFASNISSLARIFTGKMQKNLPKNGCHFGTHADSQPPRVAKILQEDWVLAIDDEAWDDLEGEEEAYNTSWYVEDITEIEDARHLTRGGRNFKPAYLEEDYPGRDPPPAREADKAKAPKETEEDRHRDAILKALGREKKIPHGHYTRANTVYHGRDPLMNPPSSLPPKICHLKEEITIELSILTVRAYVESSRGVIGTFEAECQLGPVSSAVLFPVLEITTSYNLLLGRAWMHPLGIVPSTVHQKLKLPWKGGVLIILGIKKLSEVYNQDAKCKYGLGYKEEMGEMPKNKHTLNENFVKPREDFLYCGFPEPRGDKDLVEDEADEDWMKQMDLEAMKMFVQERDVFHIEEELKEDPVAIIMPSDGITTNVVSIPKKEGKVRMCVDFKDLNRTCPKDDFPLPLIDVLVDNTAGIALMSFMDGFSGYNQILMAPEDMMKTTFVTEWGIHCYTVMSFGLKNPYLDKYVTPTFSRFDGRKGSALVHVSKFIDSMGPYAVRLWDDIVEMFCGKYFQAEEKVTLVNLHGTKQGNGEDLLKYIHRFHDMSLDCYANYEESELVGICIDNMSPEFRAHLENLNITRWNLGAPTSLAKSPHRHKGKATISVIIHGSASDIDMDESVATNPTMTPAAIKALQRNPKFRSLFDKLGLNPEARTAATEAIMSIVAESGTHCFTAEAHASRTFLETTNAITFTDEDMDVLYPDHRRPFYLAATINEVQVRRALGAPMEVRGFGGAAEYTKGHIQLVLKVGPIIALTRFYVIDSVVPYHVLLGRPWLHKHQLISSTYHQCVKGRLNGKPIRIVANPTPFDQSESHFVEASLYDEITPAEEVSLSKPVRAPLPRCGGPDCPQQEGPESREGPSQPSCYAVDKEDNSELADAAGKSIVAEEPTAADPKIFAKEEFEVIDLSSDPSVQRSVSISASLSASKRTRLVALLKEYQDVFAWQYNEMPGIDSTLVAHSLNVKPGAKPMMLNRLPMGNFWYTVMPFGLKNTRATYQRSMTAMFHDMMHREIEDYVDDIVVKSKKREDHLAVLRKVFERCHVYKLKMNPLKCAFGVSTSKFLGFLVHQCGIDVDLTRASAIATMKPPTTHKELKSFLGKLSYIRRFIPGLATVTSTFAPLLKKGVPFSWSLECQQAFERLQDIMAKLPTVCAPIFGKPLRLYLASNNQAIGALIAQEDSHGFEQPIYYVRRALKDVETHYLRAERSCLALIYASQRLRHYFLAHKVQLMTKSHPIRSLLQRLVLSGRLAQEVDEVLMADLVDATWTLRFDGSSTTVSSGAGIILFRDDGEVVPKSFKLNFPCSNNVAEYEAYLIGLAVACEMGIKHLKVVGDSNLVVCQAQGEFSLKEPLSGGVLACCIGIQEAKRKLIEVHEKTCEGGGGISLYCRLQRLGYYCPNMSREAADLQSQCPNCQLQHDNEEVYATFASTNWRIPFLEYFFEGYHGEPLQCLNLSESQMVMKEAHAGECGEHQGKKRLYQHLLTLGYYWPTMKKDMADFVKTCDTCQVQANLIHTHPTNLQNMTTPWPFHTWGLDLIGPIGPASGGHIWILVATEYFSKWVEAIPLRKGTGAALANFIREHIITHFGIPYKLISDNGTPFINKDVREVLEHYRVKHRHSTPYYPQGNGQAKTTNRMLLQILSKMVFDYGSNWSSHLADVLWAYQSSPKTATGFTPFSLVYGTDTISPTELVVPTPRVLQGSDLEVDANICAEARMADLEDLDESRELARLKSQHNYQKMANAYSKTLQVRIFAEG
uniref:Integrase catalytic domain-containing protein n=1 Tax=Fagus sylvatica TaxID=28930 RepID=A0A2N9G339_FAGSY